MKHRKALRKKHRKAQAKKQRNVEEHEQLRQELGDDYDAQLEAQLTQELKSWNPEDEADSGLLGMIDPVIRLRAKEDDPE